MSKLPVIVAQGGISPAGRTSGFHGYRRLVFESLDKGSQQETLSALKVLRNLPAGADQEEILAGTLIRQLEDNLFNSQAIPFHQAITAGPGSEIILHGRRLPDPIPPGWQLEKLADGRFKVRIEGHQPLMLPSTRQSPVNAAGQLPGGFAPEKLYQSRNHPRSLAMTIYGASDAVHSSGLDWSAIKQKLSPEQIGVYAGSAMSQMDYNGNGGVLQARLLGKRVTSKQCPLGFAEMAADFINAYVLGSLGGTGTSMGACATMLYNLEQAATEIRSGRLRLVVVGNSEAPITPEIIEGYSTMGALSTDAALKQLDGLPASASPDWRRACRPFGDNAGFTLAESSQFLVLMDDELALECGAEILGSVADVFINADGYKKSISAPGAGNHLTVARAAALGRAIVGEESLRYRSFIQAHGTGTPQNRLTESQILSSTAKVFGMENWPVAAVKSYVGHSIGAAGGDQIMATLGAWRHGIIPGIKTINQLGSDVYSEKLNILMDDLETGTEAMDMALINAKGFGGNNATALLLSPEVTQKMLTARHGNKAMVQWQQRNESVSEQQSSHEEGCCRDTVRPVYQFGEGVMEGSDLHFNEQQITVPGYGKPLNLHVENPFWLF